MEEKKLWSKEQLRAFIKENNLVTANDAQKALKELFKDTLQEMLEAELETDLGYEKHEKTGKSEGNRRNGYSEKTIRSEYGNLNLTMLRDRNGTFEPIVVKKHQKNVTGIEDQILALYAKGVSTREIQDQFLLPICSPLPQLPAVKAGNSALRSETFCWR
jgi:putative transposase